MMDEQIAEEALIAKAQAGDQTATEALIARYHALLWLLANRVSPRIHTFADDLVQAGYVGFLRALARFEPGKETRLITYAVPWILGEMKCMLRRSYADSVCLSLEEEHEQEGKRSLLDVLGGGDEISIEAFDLRLAMEKLEPQEQKVICLRYFRDQKQAETARLLGKSQAQISRIEHRALDQLRQMLV